MVAKKVLLSTTPTATTSTYFSEKLRAFYPQDIAKDEDGNLLIGVNTVQPFNPVTGAMEMLVRTIPGGLIKTVNFGLAIGATGYTATVPVGKRWVLLGFTADLQTTATVGNRILSFSIVNATGTLWVGPLSTAIAASQFGGYDVAFGGVSAPSTTVRRRLDAATSTNVQVICSNPIAQLTSLGGAALNIDDTANIDNADTIIGAYTVVEYDL